MAQALDLQITCPNCSTEFTTNAYTYLDAADEADAELLYQLQNNALNIATCPNCGATGLIPVPLVLHSPEDQFIMAYVPNATELKEEELSQMLGPLLQSLIESAPEEVETDYLFEPIVTDDRAALVMAARGEVVEEDEDGEGYDGEEAELSPEEQQAIGERLALVQKLYDASDSLERITLLRQYSPIVDEMLIEMIQALEEEYQTVQPEAVPQLQKFINEIEVFLASRQ